MLTDGLFPFNWGRSRCKLMAHYLILSPPPLVPSKATSFLLLYLCCTLMTAKVNMTDITLSNLLMTLSLCLYWVGQTSIMAPYQTSYTGVRLHSSSFFIQTRPRQRRCLWILGRIFLLSVLLQLNVSLLKLCICILILFLTISFVLFCFFYHQHHRCSCWSVYLLLTLTPVLWRCVTLVLLNLFLLFILFSGLHSSIWITRTDWWVFYV